jgi:hypothetical protein
VILIWRGWGLFALVAFFPVLASCGLLDLDQKWPLLLALLTGLTVGGIACVHMGRRWNRHGNEHSFYFVPLQYWGWGYLALAGLLAIALVIGALNSKLRESDRIAFGIVGAAFLVVIGIAIGLTLKHPNPTGDGDDQIVRNSQGDRRRARREQDEDDW